MRKTFLIACCLLFIVRLSSAQSIGVGTTIPNSSAILDITHTGKGLLIPRMGTSSIDNISAPAKGLMVYDSIANQLMINMGTPAVRNWQNVSSKASWGLGGNSGINPASQFIGNTDNQPLRFRINNIQAGELHPSTGNVFWGLRAGQANTTGRSNVAIGTDALKLNTTRNNLIAIGDSALFNNSNGASANEAIANMAIGSKALFTNTRGNLNTAIGYFSLYSNTTGYSNTAIGLSSLYANATGFYNTATGNEALTSNLSGNSNTAMGYQSLFNNNSNANTAMGAGAMKFNVSGSNNTATGFQALSANIEGFNNTAFGSEALAYNTIGYVNTAIGYRALVLNTTGIANTSMGNQSMYYNTGGNRNTAVGSTALFYNTIGADNTAIGEQALYLASGSLSSQNTAVGGQTLHATINSQNNTAVGYFAGNLYNLGYNNTFLGANADATAPGIYNSIAIGESSKTTGSNQVRIGNGANSSIGGYANWTNISDGRYKKNIQEDVKGIDFIMRLRPVTYQLDISGINQKLNINSEKDEVSKRAVDEKEKTLFTGFIAQEVEQAAKATGYDFSGVDKPKNENDFYGLRYAEFVVPLVKAMQEQQQMINELKKQNDELRKTNSAQKDLTADLLKRLEQLESSVKR